MQKLHHWNRTVNTPNSRTCCLIALLAVFSVCTERAISYPVDIEMTQRAYDELKLANRETQSRQEYGDNRPLPVALSAAHSNDM